MKKLRVVRIVLGAILMACAVQVHGQTEETDANGVPLKLYPEGYPISHEEFMARQSLMNELDTEEVNTNPAPLVPGDKANMHWLDAEFTMGSPATEAERNSDETQHTVVISYGFYMANFEVTQGEYQQIVGSNPSFFVPANGYGTDLNRPVESVTWLQASNYCYLLTQQAVANGTIQSGWAYRLPTEAEWEYSCRGKTVTTPDHVVYSQTDVSGELNTGGVTIMNNGNSIFTPQHDITLSSMTVRMQAHSTSGGISFLFSPKNSGGNTLSVEDDYDASDSLFASVQGSFGDVTLPVAPNSVGNVLYAGLGVIPQWGSFQGNTLDFKGTSGSQFSPYLTLVGNDSPNALDAFCFGNTLHGGAANFDCHTEYDAAVGSIAIAHPLPNPSGQVSDVGSYHPNSFGLYDMHGNVAEWCQDWYGSYPTTTVVDPQGPATGTARVVRGGSYADPAVACRSAARSSLDPTSSSLHVGFRIVLAPAVPEWKTAVSRTPNQIIYGNYPIKQSGKDNLIVITHGWVWQAINPFGATYQSWVDTMSNNIVVYMTNHGINNWQVYGYHWEPNAWTFTAPDALYNAKGEGENLGSAISIQGWSHVHFIGHSAGAEVIQEASQWVKAHGETAHCTFLDPYVGNDYAGVHNYGSNTDWSDCYFSHDITGDVTEQPLEHAYNVNVTQLGPQISLGQFRSQVTGQIERCTRSVKYHGWPIDFYMNSITRNDVDSDYADFGFPQSKEGGGWGSGIPNYTIGNGTAGHAEAVRVLGTPDPTCISGVYVTAPTWPELIFDFSSLPTVQSDTGSNQKGNGNLILTPGSPSWVATIITTTNPINTVSFDVQFSGISGSEDMLSVLWDTNTIGRADERITSTNLLHYSMRFNNAAANETHVLSFRLDPYTSAKSSVLLTNVVVTQIGPALPFTLSQTTSTTNGLLVWQLNGEAGYAYGIQASTNIASTNWTDVAELINTNGTVQFFDQDSTNYPTRFYRAYVPLKQ